MHAILDTGHTLRRNVGCRAQCSDMNFNAIKSSKTKLKHFVRCMAAVVLEVVLSGAGFH